MCNNNSINSNEKSSVLIDKTKSGKIRPWREKKMANVDYFELLHILEFKKAERVKDCAEVLEYKVSYETGEKTLYRVWFCKSRLCPMCNWRREMKHGIQSQKVVAEVIKQKPTVRWLFLTLTVRNVYDGTELNKSLSDMSKGFNRMMKYKKINKNLVGFMRATEVTVNNIDNSYNQHMHVLVCVESTYFYNTENYVNQKQWIQFWKRAMKLDYDPNVKVQMIRPKNKHKSDIKSAIDETAKYPGKDTDFMTEDEERNLQRLADLEEGLYRKRLSSYGGLLKEIHKELNLDDAEDGDLIHTDDEEKADEDGFSIIAMWNWERKNYFIKE
uniref:RepU n=1 Tax=Staphylococcus arlettae TaxID=29378 RepID=A0A286KT62_9STAP|nr:protein rep [Staphylococcus arlettae]ARO44724.1 RepU [Staphylococcus arlettae]